MMLGGSLIFVAHATGAAHAQVVLPSGGRVVSGQAAIAAPSGNALTVTQTTSRAVVDWNGFSIGQTGSVNFVQPGANSAILNRVTGSTGSSIAGQISGNGQVFLVNPNGIAITPTGSVRVGGGFVGSTLDIANSDFNNGNLTFAGKGTSAGVSNAGSISSAPRGFVGLIGGTVTNSGIISVPLGRIGLGSGEQATIDPSGDGFLQVAVPTTTRSANGQSLIDVAGRIHAAGGRIEIKAATAQQAVRDAVNITGTLSARSVSGSRGNIVLDGGDGGTVSVSGTIAATGGKHQTGGTIVATGNNVRLKSTARLDASGATGGKILVGGDLRGGLDPSGKLVAAPVRTARTTAVETGAAINASGTDGAGGTAVVWSDVATDFRGTINATGSGAGSGGAVEVSSHGILGYNGFTDVRAASGRTGSLLLDPYDVTISNGSDTTIAGSGNPFSPTGNNSVLSVSTLQSALASANVTVTTGSSGSQNGDITVANAVTWGSGNTLTLSAARDIIVNASITTTNGGGLNLTGGRNVSVFQNIVSTGGPLDVNLTALSNGGSITVSGATINNNGGNLTTSGTQAGVFPAVVLSNATLDVGGGTGTISGSSTSGVAVGLSGSSMLRSSGGGSITLNGTATTSGVGILIGPGASVTSTGNVTLNGTSPFLGIYSPGNNTLTDASGDLTINGHSTGNSGIFLAGNQTMINAGSGMFSMTGTGQSYRGLDFYDSANLTLSGNMTLSGTATSGVGTHFQRNAFTVTSGNVGINGTSSSGTGVQFANATTTVANNGAGSLAIAGVSATGAGLETLANAALSISSGNLNLSGSSSSAPGIRLLSDSSIANSGSGALKLTATGDADLRGSISSPNGNLTVTSSANLVIASGATISGANPILAATGSFTNNAGSGAVTARSGRWLIYSNNPTADTFGGLDSGNTAIWNSSNSAQSISASGNRYLFAYQPTLTFTSTSATKTYGTDVTASIGNNYTVSGFQSGVANAFLGDTAGSVYSGAPAVTSTGAAGTADVAGSPYTMTIGAGSLSSLTNYAFAFRNSGQLAVTPAPVNVTALGGSSTYGSSPVNPGLSATGLQNGQDVRALTGLFNSFGIRDGTAVGSYQLGVAGALTNPNYTVAGTSGASWSVAALRSTNMPSASFFNAPFPSNQDNGNTLDAAATPPANAPAAAGETSPGAAAGAAGKAAGAKPGLPNGSGAPGAQLPGTDMRGTSFAPNTSIAPNLAPITTPSNATRPDQTAPASAPPLKTATCADERGPGCAEKTPAKAPGVIDFALSKLNRNALAQAIEQEISDIKTSKTVAFTVLTTAAAGTSIAVTVGILGWLLRGGALLSALLSSMPIWREFDPLMVVTRTSRKDETHQPASKVDRMFDSVRGIRTAAGGMA